MKFMWSWQVNGLWTGYKNNFTMVIPAPETLTGIHITRMRYVPSTHTIEFNGTYQDKNIDTLYNQDVRSGNEPYPSQSPPLG